MILVTHILVHLCCESSAKSFFLLAKFKEMCGNQKKYILIKLFKMFDSMPQAFVPLTFSSVVFLDQESNNISLLCSANCLRFSKNNKRRHFGPHRVSERSKKENLNSNINAISVSNIASLTQRPPAGISARSRDFISVCVVKICFSFSEKQRGVLYWVVPFLLRFVRFNKEAPGGQNRFLLPAVSARSTRAHAHACHTQTNAS